MTRIGRRALLAALALATLAGCGASKNGGDGATAGAPQSGITLTGAGATFPYPIYSKWFDLYRARTGVSINYQSIGSGAGIQQMIAGTVDFGASDAPLSDEKLKEMPRPVVHIPTVGGAVVLAYNLPEITEPLRLTPEIVAGIYLGTITQWNDRRIAAANPGAKLPATPILAVHRSDGSGTTNIFTTYLSKVSPDWKSKIGANTSVSWPGGVGGKGNEGVTGLVRQSPGAIGYVELAYANQNRLTTAMLRNRAGNFVAPSLAATSAGIGGSAEALAQDVRTPTVDAAGDSAYPIASLTFLLVYQDMPDPARARALVEFIRWAIHEGQDEAEALGYARLPQAIVEVNEATLKRLTAAGQPIAAAMREGSSPAFAHRHRLGRGART